ncbi:MAG: hypothetical protein RBS49_05460 [Sphaerochaeta sp.]|jgi:hypothetical protein|nr:hypothetical protein [Sphaerochaeta sp.]MDX9915321.1 hypothetical protein [Sphaerochaeta sp.]
MDIKTRVFFDMHYPESEGVGIATALDVHQLSDSFIQSGADSFILFAKCQYGNAYYQTKVGHKHRGLGDLDFIQEMAERLHANGKEVIAYYSVAWDEWYADHSPQYLTQDAHGGTDSSEFRWRTLCLNSPYREFVLAQLVEIATECDVDGFWIDMTIIAKDRCHCPYCTKKFNALHPGQKMIDDDPLFLDFRYDYIEEFYEELYAALRAVKPSLVLMNNYWGYPYMPRSMGSRAVGSQRGVDMLTGEAYTDWTGLEAPIYFSRYLRSTGNGRPFEVLLGRFTNTWDFTRKRYDQLFFECMTVFSHGGVVTIDDQPYWDGSFDRKLYEQELRKIFSVIDTYHHTRAGRHYRHAAVLHSQLTKNHSDQNSFIKAMSGAYRLLADEHYGVDFLFDERITADELDRYQLILLPSVTHLDGQVAEALVTWAERGGTLLCFGASALAAHCGLSDGGPGIYSLSYLEQDGEYCLVRGRYQRYSHPQEEHHAPAMIVDPVLETTRTTFYHNNLPSPYQESETPQYITIVFGSGTIVFFPQPIATSYAKQPSQTLRRLVLERVATAPMYRLSAPNRVWMECYEQEDGNTVYIHLGVRGAESSLSCGLLDTMQGNFERPYVTMEARDKASDITITIAVNSTIQSVRSLFEHNSVSYCQKEGVVTVNIESVELWDVIEVAYAD